MTQPRYLLRAAAFAVLLASSDLALAGFLTGWAHWANSGWIRGHTDSGLLPTSGGAGVLFGNLYSANCGWIRLGNGIPANGTQYGNATGEDSGINRLPDGTLRGLAWSGNLGWIHFEANGNPQLDLNTGHFSGLAWSANAGWIQLSGLNLGGNAPTPNPDTLGRAPGSGLKLRDSQLLQNDSDPNGQELILVSVQDPTPTGATVELSEGWVLYLPPVGFNGTGSFTYTVLNPDGLQATATVLIPVNPNPDTPPPNLILFELLPNGTIHLRHAGIPGRSYQLQATLSLTPPVIWTTLLTQTADATGILDWTDPDAPANPNRFYRTDAPANP